MTVFVVHLSNRKLDLTDAGRFGTLEMCHVGNLDVINLGDAIDVLHEKLRGFCDDDYLLAVGSPVLIMAAGMIAEENSDSGVVRVLQWKPDERRYEPVAFKIWESRK